MSSLCGQLDRRDYIPVQSMLLFGAISVATRRDRMIVDYQPTTRRRCWSGLKLVFARASPCTPSGVCLNQPRLPCLPA